MKTIYCAVTVLLIGISYIYGQSEMDESSTVADGNVTIETNTRYLMFLEELKEIEASTNYDESDAEYLLLLKEVKKLGDPCAISSPTPFKLIKNGDIVGLKKYLDEGGNPNLDLRLSSTPYSLLASAVVAVNIDCAELLLKHGANANTIIGDGSTPLSLTLEKLQHAEQIKDVDMLLRLRRMVKLLNSYGASD